MCVIYLGLVLCCLMGTEAGILQSVPGTAMGEQKSLNETVPATTTPPTVANKTDSDDKTTIPILQISDYHYFDWPKIGYHIFMRKLIDAVKTLKFYLSLDPMLLKITRTYILTNDTDLDFGDNNSTDVNSEEGSQVVLPVETNTESPLLAELYKNPEESDMETNTESPLLAGLYKNPEESDMTHYFKEQSKAHKIESEDNEVKKVKEETGGFFSTITTAIASFYHTLTGWF